MIQWHGNLAIESNRGLGWDVANSHVPLNRYVCFVTHMHYLRARRPIYLSVIHDFYSLLNGVAWLQNEIVAISDAQKLKTVQNSLLDRLKLNLCT